MLFLTKSCLAPPARPSFSAYYSLFLSSLPRYEYYHSAYDCHYYLLLATMVADYDEERHALTMSYFILLYFTAYEVVHQ